jgi:diguanylate cyclase (GGDEF)-like protein
MYHLFFIDDDKDFLRSMNMAVSKQIHENSSGMDVETHFMSDPHEGLAFARELTDESEKIAVIISDQQMPELTGIELMEKANEFVPNAFKVLLTGYASLDSAKYAINNNILDQYVSKPIADYDNFTSLIKNAIKTFHFREEKERAEREIRQYVRVLEEKNEKIRNMHMAAEKIAYLSQGLRKLDLDEVLDLIIIKIPEVFSAKYSSLFLLNEENQALQMVRSNYLTENYRKSMTVVEQSPMLVALRENRTIILPEIAGASYDFLNKECLGKSCIIIPFLIGSDQHSVDILGNREGIKGVLNMGNICAMGSEDIITYAASLVRNILGIHILNARLYQKTQQLALIDGLTGLYNKHVFMEFLRKEHNYSERNGVPFYLSLMDADDFKAINDTHGHRIGDEVLAQLGSLCKTLSRKTDVAARFGGEEIALLINEGGMDEIVDVLERIRKGIQNNQFPHDIRMGVSIGLSRYSPGDNDSIEKLIDRADSALYSAKAKGKNRTEVLLKDEDKKPA